MPIDDPAPPVGPIHSLIRRRPLPSGRAVAGALLVTIAAVGTFVVAAGDEPVPDTSYLVTSRAVEVGEIVSAMDFVSVPIDLPPGLEATGANEVSNIDGATALRSIGAGELISPRDLSSAPDAGAEAVGSFHEVTIPVPLERAGQSLGAGDLVTILATVPVERASVTLVAVEDAVVVGWATGEDGIGTSATGILTLALPDPATVMEVAHLTHEGEITIVRTTRAISDPYPDTYPDFHPDTYPETYPDFHPDFHPDTYPETYPETYLDFYPGQLQDLDQGLHEDASDAGIGDRAGTDAIDP